MKKYFSILFLIAFIVPSVAFASWWNPFSWKIFQKKEIVPQVQVETKTSDEKITELQKQIEDLKKQQPTSSTTTNTPVVENKVIPKTSAQSPIKTTPTPILDSSKKDITPYINLKVNEQDGPITIKVNSLVNVSWTSANVVSCSGSTSDKPLNGRETIRIDNNTTSPFTIRCLTSNGIIVSDSVVLNITGKTLDNDDPYGVLYGTGIPYTADQLNQIDCAYYGRNCPTLHIKIDN
jgi:hypothetical protein